MDIPTAIEEFEKLRRTIPIGEDAEFVAALASHLGFATESTVEIDRVSEETDQLNERQIDVTSLLSPEQKERAEKLTAAMAEKFGVDEADFSILTTETKYGAAQQFTVAYTARNGIYKGRWDKIMDKKSTEDFTVEIDGHKVDTRIGMTLDVYTAMVEQYKANGGLLPDSCQLS